MKELVIKILEMILRFYTYTIFTISKPITCLSLLLISFLGPLWEERVGRQNRPSLYADVVGNPWEDSNIKMKGMLVGKLKLNPWEGGRCGSGSSLNWPLKEIPVRSASRPFLQISLCTAYGYLMSIFSHFPPNTLSETKICKRRAPASPLYGSAPRKQITICSSWFFVRSMITIFWEYWLCFT